jgi:hypothetical protein
VWDACFGSIRNVRVINLIAGTNGAKARILAFAGTMQKLPAANYSLSIKS